MNDRLFTLPKRLVRKVGTSDPFRIAEYLGFAVRFIDLKGTKGFCKKILRNYFIFINCNLSEEMRRMCCAHEIGHILFHKNYLATPEYLMHMELFDMHNRTEYEANLFAANLLIDDDELIEVISHGRDVVSAAATFGVNVNMLALKLAEMKKAGHPVNVPFTPDRRFLGRIEDRSDAM